jgi:pyrroline-5-carboxylate reductase
MTRILLVGAGKMGGALLRGWTIDPSYEITIVDPAVPDKPTRFDWHASPASLPSSYAPAIIVLAIKPQQMAEQLPRYQRFSRSLFLSIAAGIDLDRLQQELGGASRPVLRAMPNLPASIGQGVTALVANAYATAEDKALGQRLLEAVGQVVWLDDEAQMNAVTALSGSGPAYVAALVEAMALAGEDLGLAPERARALARQTLIGTAALLAQSQIEPADLRMAVTSPKGTTAAALDVLLADEGGLFSLLSRALAAAEQRACDLAQGG